MLLRLHDLRYSPSPNVIQTSLRYGVLANGRYAGQIRMSKTRKKKKENAALWNSILVSEEGINQKSTQNQLKLFTATVLSLKATFGVRFKNE